ncbi:MAG: hypothetical protein JXA93_13625, partial [Anaerolineae bacterium]|nr:hypothetical protein [Anaerolineae bacterium]
VKRFNPDTHTSDFTVDTEPHLPGGPYELPTPLAGEEAPATPGQPPPPEEALPSMLLSSANCISCHTDQPRLEALAVEEVVVSEKTSGEG